MLHQTSGFGPEGLLDKEMFALGRRLEGTLVPPDQLSAKCALVQTGSETG